LAGRPATAFFFLGMPQPDSFQTLDKSEARLIVAGLGFIEHVRLLHGKAREFSISGSRVVGGDECAVASRKRDIHLLMDAISRSFLPC